MSGSSPFNKPNLHTTLEMVLNRDGTVDKITIVTSSGYLPYDAAAIDVAYTAGPYPDPPREIRSPNGKIYVHWNFYRDERQCTPAFTDYFIVEQPAGGPSDKPDVAAVPEPEPAAASAAEPRPLGAAAAGSAAASAPTGGQAAAGAPRPLGAAPAAGSGSRRRRPSRRYPPERRCRDPRVARRRPVARGSCGASTAPAIAWACSGSIRRSPRPRRQQGWPARRPPPDRRRRSRTPTIPTRTRSPSDGSARSRRATSGAARRDVRASVQDLGQGGREASDALGDVDRPRSRGSGDGRAATASRSSRAPVLRAALGKLPPNLDDGVGAQLYAVARVRERPRRADPDPRQARRPLAARRSRPALTATSALRPSASVASPLSAARPARRGAGSGSSPGSARRPARSDRRSR